VCAIIAARRQRDQHASRSRRHDIYICSCCAMFKGHCQEVTQQRASQCVPMLAKAKARAWWPAERGIPTTKYSVRGLTSRCRVRNRLRACWRAPTAFVSSVCPLRMTASFGTRSYLCTGTTHAYQPYDCHINVNLHCFLPAVWSYLLRDDVA
jgi:hypothetical protein